MNFVETHWLLILSVRLVEHDPIDIMSSTVLYADNRSECVKIIYCIDFVYQQCGWVPGTVVVFPLFLISFKMF
jgi:hypothetical protein